MFNLKKFFFLPFNPPKNEQELIKKAKKLNNLTLGEISYKLGISIPINLNKNKGWIGYLLEYCLGANSGSKPQQDFNSIGIELKTIPINKNKKSKEATFICVAPLIRNIGVIWEKSYIRKKLKKILWIPIETKDNISLSDRRIVSPFIWSPNKEEEYLIRQDWEELMNLIVLGNIKKINSDYGEVLQLKHKSSKNNKLTIAIGKLGEKIFNVPLAFYLKKEFTTKILLKNFNKK